MSSQLVRPRETRSGSSGAVDRGEEVGEGLVRADDVARCVEIHKEAADDGENDRGKFGASSSTCTATKGDQP